MTYAMRLAQFTRTVSEHNLTKLSNPLWARTTAEVRADKRAFK